MTQRNLIVTSLAIAFLCLVASREASAQAPGQVPSGGYDASPRQPSIAPEKDEGISHGRIAGEIIVGGVAGMAGAVIGGLVGAGVEDCSGDPGLYCGLAGALIGGYAGYVGGVATGVYGIGSGGDHQGSFGATLGGSALGGAGALALTIGSDGDLAILLPIAPVVGSLIGFHSTAERRPERRKAPPVIGSLLNVDQGQASLGLPMLNVSTSGESGSTTILQLAGGRI